MTASMAEYKCHTTAEKAIRAELDISEYNLRYYQKNGGTNESKGLQKAKQTGTFQATGQAKGETDTADRSRRTALQDDADCAGTRTAEKVSV